MKIISVLTLLFSHFSYTDDNILYLDEFRNSCRRILQTRIKVQKSSRGIHVLNWSNQEPNYQSSKDFFSGDLDNSEIFVYQGEGAPNFSRHVVSEWRSLDATILNFNEDIYFIKRELLEDGEYRFTFQTRFSLDDVASAFVEIMHFFKVVTGTMGRGSGVDYLSVLQASELKQQVIALLKGWEVDTMNPTIEEFKYNAVHLLSDPAFKMHKPRMIRHYFQKLLKSFRASFPHKRGYDYKYEQLLDNLERKRLLQYVLLM